MDDEQELNTEIRYREYQEGDEKSIVKLFNFVFNRNLTLSDWKWTYEKNPLNRIDIILAFNDNNLVGQSAGTPLQFSFNDIIVQTTRIQNVMVHPNYRGRGIFTGTLAGLTDHIYRNKLDLVVTFPNNNSLPAFIRKLDYHHIGNIPTFSIPVPSLNLPGSAKITIKIDDSILFNEIDREFMYSNLNEYKIFNYRDLNYLHWRFNRKSGKKYYILRAFLKGKLAALVIFKFYLNSQSVDLVEFFVRAKTNIIDDLLAKIISFYKKQNLSFNSFNIWSLPHYSYYDFLIESGFVQTNFSTHIVTKSFSPKTRGGFDLQTSYYISMGDSDVY
jgi:hypothetical protein